KASNRKGTATSETGSSVYSEKSGRSSHQFWQTILPIESIRSRTGKPKTQIRKTLIMYITITPQKISEGYSKSSMDFVNYLEKENEDKSPDKAEQFFDQIHDKITHDKVVMEIDANTKKLRSRDPRFYSITISPS